MANQRPNVPKFGNWEGEDVPYTVVFDKARKNKVGGKIINPNDPLENPEMFAHLEPSSMAAPPPKPKDRKEEPTGRGGFRPAPEQRLNREGGEVRRFNNPSAGNEPKNYGGRGQGQGQRTARSAKHSAGSDQSFERSPYHANYQKNVMGRGSVSPAWEGKSHDNSSHGTPARSKLRHENSEKGAAIPKFGDWNENDPQSAENFTHMFNILREERNTGGAGNASATPKPSPYAPRNPPSNETRKCCCFPWW